eukprot:jgi/Chlat1/2266/Chrsp17S08727
MAAVAGPAASAAAAAQAAVQAAQAASLYVGDLEREVTEAQLYEVFSQVGPVASIRVCRDAVTRRSLGYAYVNYNAALDDIAAERALETLNYTPINGKPIRIMWSHRDPATRKSGVGNIFIKNLDETIDNKALHDTFSAFGHILSCKIATVEGKSKGYGFVHYDTQDAADLAIEKVNGMLLEGRKVYVGPFIKRNERDLAGSTPRFTNVFVKNLDTEITEEQLSEQFSNIGPLLNVVIMRDTDGKSKGFGFVNFERTEDAAEAVDKLNGEQLGAKALYCGRAEKKTERENKLRQQFEDAKMERQQKYQGVNLYIKNLDDSVDDDQLRKEFMQYGTITSAKVMRNEKGVSKGFAFVCFSSAEEATKAVTEGNGRMLLGKPIYVALAQRREVRRAQLEAQYAQRMGMSRGSLGAPMPGGPMYPPGTPIFYAAPAGMPPGAPRQNLVYQPVMAPRGWRGPQARPGFQPMPNGFMPVPMPQQQGGPPSPQGMPQNRAPRQNRQRGSQPPPPQPQQQAPQQPQPAQPQQPSQSQPEAAKQPRSGPQRPVQHYAAAARGQLQAAPAGAPAPQHSLPGPQEPLTTAMLSAASPEQQKQMLGERLYPQVENMQPELAGKITGMLLEMDNSELLLLLESTDALTSKVDEAITVLRQHAAQIGEQVA